MADGLNIVNRKKVISQRKIIRFW